MSRLSRDADGVFFATLVDCLGTYPKASLGSVMSRLRTGGEGRAASAGAGPLPSDPVAAAAAGRDRAWPLGREEESLVTAWQAVLGGSAQAASLPDVVRRTERFLNAVAAGTARCQPPPSSSQCTAAVLRVLAPLLARLSRAKTAAAGASMASSVPLEEEEDAGEAMPLAAARAAYGRLAPLALEVAIQEAPGGVGALLRYGEAKEVDKEEEEARAALYAWLWRQATGVGVAPAHPPQRRCDAAGELLTSYIATAVEPLEKELRFHFQPGRETAKRHEPQHFFAFLGELLTVRLRGTHAHATGGAAGNGGRVSGDGPISLLVLGQVAIAVTAAAIFQETYQWSPTSPLLASESFTVHTLNAFFDFIAANEARLSREALLVLSRHVAIHSAVSTFLNAAVATAAEAFADAPAVLWRRAVLQQGDADGGGAGGGCLAVPGAGVFLARTVHLTRCVEALMRRLCATLLLADPHAWRGVVGARLVGGALSGFLDAARAALAAGFEDAGLDETDPAAVWLLLGSRFELVESARLIAAAAEDWLGLLTGDAPTPAAARLASEVLDELVLLRDSMARAAADTARGVLADMAGSREARLARAVYGLDAFLSFMENGPAARTGGMTSSSTKFILETVLRDGVAESFTADQRAAIHDYAERQGLARSAELLLS